jgi:hypothetical protein
MGMHLNALSAIEKEALKDYGQEKYFCLPADQRSMPVEEWVHDYTESLAKNHRASVLEIATSYAKQRGLINRL